MTFNRTKSILLLSMSFAGFASSSAAFGQTLPDDVANPPPIAEEGASAAEFVAAAPSAIPPARVLDLKVVYTDSQIFNPATGQYDKVRLRSYNGTDVSPTAPYVSPTIEIVPGQTVRVNLDNKLPADPSCSSANHNVDTPHCFNGTNLHTHGLWVSPAGNGDNVLLSINPGVKFQYEYNIPSDHPSGTFWYHTHRHGSTALQVSSGMAGALIIRGNRLPTPTQNGDIDILTGQVKERVLVMQQIQYACRTAPSPGHPHGEIQRNPPTKGATQGTYLCNPGDVGVIEDYDQFGPGTWTTSGRFTSINGQVLPTFSAVQGQVERWRMIHGGVRDTINLQFLKAKPGRLSARLPLLKSGAEATRFVAANCTTEALPYTLIAADGLTMDKGMQTRISTFQPGYRWDALVVFPDDVDPNGVDYCVVDTSVPPSGSVPGGQPGTELLGFVRVSKGEKVTDVGAQVGKTLIEAAKASAMAPEMKASVIADLANGLKFSRFVPHPDILASEVTGKQELTFFIDTTGASVKFEVGNTLQTGDVRPYNPNRIDRQLTLGGVDEWTLQSHFVSHPFHIHVNPFQIVSIMDPNGKEVSAPGAVDDAGGNDPQYPGLRGVWKDTLWIKSLLPLPSPLPKGWKGGNGIYTITIRTRYQRYIGEYVLHCHILDHEDQGMMQNVEVVLPTGFSGDPATGAAPPEGQKHSHH